jgi:hypothetical protein
MVLNYQKYRNWEHAEICGFQLPKMRIRSHTNSIFINKMRNWYLSASEVFFCILNSPMNKGINHQHAVTFLRIEIRQKLGFWISRTTAISHDFTRPSFDVTALWTGYYGKVWKSIRNAPRSIKWIAGFKCGNILFLDDELQIGYQRIIPRTAWALSSPTITQEWMMEKCRCNMTIFEAARGCWIFPRTHMPPVWCIMTLSLTALLVKA